MCEGKYAKRFSNEAEVLLVVGLSMYDVVGDDQGCVSWGFETGVARIKVAKIAGYFDT